MGEKNYFINNFMSSPVLSGSDRSDYRSRSVKITPAVLYILDDKNLATKILKKLNLRKILVFLILCLPIFCVCWKFTQDLLIKLPIIFFYNLLLICVGGLIRMFLKINFLILSSQKWFLITKVLLILLGIIISLNLVEYLLRMLKLISKLIKASKPPPMPGETGFQPFYITFLSNLPIFIISTCGQPSFPRTMWWTTWAG